jgi:hypothetical protein
MKPKDVRSFDDLRNYLATFSTWDGDHVHDFGGAFILLGALLDNIRENVTDANLECTGDYLTDEQKIFFLRLAELAQHPSEEE